MENCWGKLEKKGFLYLIHKSIRAICFPDCFLLLPIQKRRFILETNNKKIALLFYLDFSILAFVKFVKIDIKVFSGLAPWNLYLVFDNKCIIELYTILAEMITKNCSIYSNSILLQELSPKCLFFFIFPKCFFKISSYSVGLWS